MTPATLSHFGLKRMPFHKELEDTELWLPSSKQTVVEELVEALQARGSALLTGEPGVGKTCVLRALRQRLPPSGFRLTYCHNATLGRRDFYRQLCLALGLKPTATAAALFFSITSQVEQLGQERVHPVLLLDEAHLLHQDVLDHLHVLLNYQWDSRALLSLVLVGLPELETRLERRHQRSLYSRLHTRLRLEPLSPDDTAEYLRHRLALAGCEREVFASDSVALLHEAASGSLRDLDRLASAALREAARSKRKLVERDCLQRALKAAASEAR
jgi:type II secretory pathway predicted ATPase ExeA